MRYPLPNPAEWDFSYLESCEHLKRSAVLYEYSRENSELVKWILYFRKFGPLGSSKPCLSTEQAVKDEIQEQLHQVTEVLSFTEVLFLATSKSFPSKPFQSALKHLDRRVAKDINGGIISEPPRQIREIPDGVWHRAHNPSGVSDQFAGRGESVHIFAIPWHGTSNDELASQFRSWLDDHRPKQFPSDRRRGRNSGTSAGANHKLHQLGAYRLQRAGISREQAWAMGFKHYSSESAWNRAVSRADDRIKQVYPFQSGEPPQ